ncbi:MAG TPA: NTP transferase domain-containing protein, partial [Kineosporiaceae bacterium]|nr:NTP transferase domain-containing protein [Kineosporiaceae bacterium]
DKTAAALVDRPVLMHVIDAVLPEAGALAVVGPADHPARAQVEAAARRAERLLVWTREEPAGGGPVPGLAAGLAGLFPDLADTADSDRPAGAADAHGSADAADTHDRTVVVLAGDLPFARTALPRLLAALAATGADAALGVDPDGHRQPLLAAYRAAPLRQQLRGATVGPLPDLPLRAVLSGLTVVEVPVSTTEAFDLDTPQALTTALALISP